MLQALKQYFQLPVEESFGGAVGVQGTARTAHRTHLYLFARLFLQAIDPSTDFTERMKFWGQSDHPLGAFENNLLYSFYYYSNI